MKCSQCGTELIPGNNICPNCGALNMSFTQPVQQVSNTQNQNVSAFSETQMQSQVQNPVQPQVQMPIQMQSPVQMPIQSQVQPQMPSLNNSQDILNINQNNIQAQENITAPVESLDSIEDLDEGPAEVVNASADMQAPTLSLNSNEVQAELNAQDIGAAGQNASIYGPEDQTPEQNNSLTLEDIKAKEANQVEIAIPKVQAPVKDPNQKLENGVPIIQNEKETTGVKTDETKVKNNPKIKISLLKMKSVPQKVFLIAIVVTLIMGVLIGKFALGTTTYVAGSSNRNTSKEKIKFVSDGKNNETLVGDYKYKIPEDYVYDKTNEGLVIYNPNDTFKIFIKLFQGDYSKISTAQESLARSLSNESINVNASEIVEKHIGNAEVLELRTIYKNNNRLIGIRKKTDDTIYYIEVVDTDNSYNEEALEIANDICENAEYVDSDDVTKLESFEVQDLSDFMVIISEAAEKIN